MRKSLLMVGIPVSVVGLGLAGFFAMRATPNKASDVFANDLQRAEAAGVELAQAQVANKFALSETAPATSPERSAAIKRGNGTKAIRSRTPTVKAAPEPVAAEVVEEIPQLQVIQTVAAPSATEATAPSIPRPVPQNGPAPSEDQGPILIGGQGRGAGTGAGGGGMGTGDGRTGTGSGAGGGGGGWGGIFGAVIRGGGVDGDNCDPRPQGNRPPMRTPVYAGNPGGRAPSTGNTTVRTGLPAIQPAGRTGGTAARPRGGR
jgi:hypothetical protein